GAVPTSMTATEVYNSLESGVIDAASFAQHAHLSFGVMDIADWWTENLNPGTVNCPVVVNVDAYEALSDEHRAILDEAVEESIDHYLANYAELLEGWEQTLAEKEVTKVTVAQEDIDAMRANAAPIHEAWIEEATANGLPGQELYDLATQAVAENAPTN
ncbi:MAG: C4-dicarboxylate ABC transporter substrate-binding protein, partial [Pseudomonadota bacterium]